MILILSLVNGSAFCLLDEPKCMSSKEQLAEPAPYTETVVLPAIETKKELSTNAKLLFEDIDNFYRLHPDRRTVCFRVTLPYRSKLKAIPMSPLHWTASMASIYNQGHQISCLRALIKILFKHFTGLEP